MILKTRLKELLEERGLTQAQLAEMAGIRPNTVSEMSKNMRDSIHRANIGKIAQALNIKDVSELLYFDEE